MKEKKESRLGGILLMLCFLVGLSLVLYPSVADYWNTSYSTHAISVYSEKTKEMSEDQYADVLQAARDYNAGARYRTADSHMLSDTDMLLYESMLSIDDSGQMGYIDIPTIRVTLPIYHGTSEEVLQNGVGHVEWTSLPVGGKSTHCALSGHRGLPSAKLFTNLDKLVVGDVFTLCVLNEVLTYEVDQILIVEPQDTKDLQIFGGRDYCTLITCTPYGINTHRLLVRGHRIENEEQPVTAYIAADAIQIEPTLVAAVLGFPVLVAFMIGATVSGGDRKKKNLTGEKTIND